MPADRNRLIKLIHTGARSLGMDDTARRDMMELAAGARSCSDMSVKQLNAVLAALREKGFRSSGSTRGPRAASRSDAPNTLLPKIRALWISLHELGLVIDPSDKALDRWQRDVSKVAAASWLTPAQAAKVIEGLKAWAARDASVDWDEDPDPRVCVLRAQWRLLAARGVVRVAVPAGLDGWLSAAFAGHKTGVTQLTPTQKDAAIRALGGKLRKALAGRAPVPRSSDPSPEGYGPQGEGAEGDG